ncbi:hypothetical protein WJX79_001442 [Trebouxia sp. C0005]
MSAMKDAYSLTTLASAANSCLFEGDPALPLLKIRDLLGRQESLCLTSDFGPSQLILLSSPRANLRMTRVPYLMLKLDL